MLMKPMPKTDITFRIDEEERQAIDHVAKALDRDRSYVLNQAVRAYLEVQEWQRRHIEEAVREADAGGPFVAHEEMERWLESWGTDDELPAPKANLHRQDI